MKLRGRFVCLTILVMNLILIPVVSSVDYFVDSGNGDDSNDGLTWDTAWKTINRAAKGSSPGQEPVQGNAIDAGDTVNVNQGVYEEAIRYMANAGESNKRILYKAYGEVIIKNGDFWLGCAEGWVGAGYTTVEGFSLIEGSFIIGINSVGVEIKDCRVVKSGDCAFRSFYASPASSVRIENCLIYDSAEGLEFGLWGAHLEIVNCTVVNCNTGIHINEEATNPLIKNCNIVDCNTGINAPEHTCCDFNNFWSNGTNYTGGVASGAHDSYCEVHFLDEDNHLYYLDADYYDPYSPCCASTGEFGENRGCCGLARYSSFDYDGWVGWKDQAGCDIYPDNSDVFSLDESGNVMLDPGTGAIDGPLYSPVIDTGVINADIASIDYIAHELTAKPPYIEGEKRTLDADRNENNQAVYTVNREIRWRIASSPDDQCLNPSDESWHQTFKSWDINENEPHLLPSRTQGRYFQIELWLRKDGK